MNEIQYFVTPTAVLEGINPITGESFRHSVRTGRGAGPGATTFYNELDALIEESKSLKDYFGGLSELLKRWKIDESLLPPF